MKIENVKIARVNASWLSNRRNGEPKGKAKVVLEIATDDMNALAHVQSIAGESVTVDFGAPAQEEAKDDDRN